MTDHDPQKQQCGTAKTPHCEYCLQDHAEDGSCFCADCKCDMHPEFIVPYRDGDTRIALCPDCYDIRRSTNSKQVDDQTCPSCGVAYHDHLGLIQTCAKLKCELDNKRALEAYIAKLEAQIKVLQKEQA